MSDAVSEKFQEIEVMFLEMYRTIATSMEKKRPDGESFEDFCVSLHCTLMAIPKPPEPPQPQYRTPTDDDAKSRPTVRVRNNNDEEWKEATLIFVDDGGVSPHYFTTIKVMFSNDRGWSWFRQCEIVDDGGPL